MNQNYAIKQSVMLIVLLSSATTILSAEMINVMVGIDGAATSEPDNSKAIQGIAQRPARLLTSKKGLKVCAGLRLRT